MRRYLAVTTMVLLVAISVLPAVSGAGQWPPNLERILFIHQKSPLRWRRPPPREDGYYKLLGVKWRSFPVSIDVNPANPSGLGSSTVLTTITVSAEEWDNGAYSNWGGVTPNLFQVRTTFSTKTYDDLAWTNRKRDGSNTLVWGNYPTSGVIAVTILWINPLTKTIVEFDMVLDTDYAWTISGEIGKMDLQNIATHELGHGAGLGDVAQNAACLETMYGYSTLGEIIKRDLYTGDKLGITTSYG